MDRDPACGFGDFPVIADIRMREIESENKKPARDAPARRSTAGRLTARGYLDISQMRYRRPI